jgi:hypothetical protein
LFFFAARPARARLRRKLLWSMIAFVLLAVASALNVGAKMAANAAVKSGKYTAPPANSVKFDGTKFKVVRARIDQWLSAHVNASCGLK